MANWGTKQPKLAIPYYPSKDNKENPYLLATVQEKTVAKYLGISMFDVENLTVLEFKFYLREAFIYNCSMSQEGIEYLKNAKRLETSEPERDKLRKKKGH